MWCAAIALLVNVISCLILIPLYGAVGAAYANVGALTAWNGVLWWICWRQHGIDTSLFGWRTNADLAASATTSRWNYD